MSDQNPYTIEVRPPRSTGVYTVNDRHLATDLFKKINTLMLTEGYPTAEVQLLVDGEPASL